MSSILDQINAAVRDHLICGDSVIGFSEEDATKYLKTLGYTVRVVSRDTENYICTQDNVPMRMNLSIVDGDVVAAQVY